MKTCHKNKKDKIKEYQRNKYQELVQYKKEALKNKYLFCSLLSIKISEKNTKI